MYFTEVDFATPDFDLCLDLRNRILRIPLQLEFNRVDIEKEYDQLHFAVFSNKRNLIACLTLAIVGPQQVKMRQVAVEETMQGKGIGRFIVEHSEHWCRTNAVNKIVLHARLNAVPFYKRIHYKTIGNQFTEVNIPHYKMEKIL